MTSQRSVETDSPRRWVIACCIAWASGLGWTVFQEIHRARDIAENQGTFWTWLNTANTETTWPLFLLGLFPLLWWLRRRGLRPAEEESDGPKPLWRAWLLALLVAASSWSASAWVGSTPVSFRDGGVKELSSLPPAYHDEYSYLFQARTFLEGKLANAANHDVPAIFDQIHVLNDRGKFASRYFPGTGMWIAPFVVGDRPYWGHWLAGAWCAFFVFWAGRELSGDAVGFIAGMLTALSPGMATFSNLLLAHHPTLVGLSLFLWAFLRFMRLADDQSCGRQAALCAFMAGCGLSFAMLCRPMTAAGFGLPFGLWLAFRLVRGTATLQQRLLQTVLMGLPIAACLGVIFVYNQATTGDGLTTPYQLYTDIYTPRHVYGFDNVKRGEKRLGPKVLDNYDKWAENLTPPLAWENVKTRWIASWQWTLAVVPLLCAVPLFLLLVLRRDARWWLVASAILSLHAAHVPYWFTGIRHWHYVFETGPLWLLIFAAASVGLCRGAVASRRYGVILGWTLLAALAGLPNWVAAPPLWNSSRVSRAVHEDAWARKNYAVFRRAVSQLVEGDMPALVLIAPSPDERHIDYVTNPPTLDADIVFGRFRPKQTPLKKVLAAFPKRKVFAVLIDPAAQSAALRSQFPGVEFEHRGVLPLLSTNPHQTAVAYRLFLK